MMERLLDTPILKFHPDTLEAVRRQCGLGAAGEVGRAVDILREWIQQQPHFLHKDFPPKTLEVTIINAKGSIEKAKRVINKICTYRTMTPKYFGDFNLTKDFEDFDGKILYGFLPKLSQDHCRYILFQNWGKCFESTFTAQLGRLAILAAEYLKCYDYSTSLIGIFDMRHLDWYHLLTVINILDAHNILKILMEGYGLRIKVIHILAPPSKPLELVMGIIKQAISEKMASRLCYHKSLETLYDQIPRIELPEDFGGEEKPLLELHAECKKELSSPELLSWLRSMAAAGTDEALRPRTEGDDFFAGVSGTFRALSID